MSIYLKIVLVLCGLAYLISPVDIIPDFLIPYVGWLDDGLVLWTIFYLIRYKRLPDFLFRKKPEPQKPGAKQKQYTGPNQRSNNQARQEQNKSDPMDSTKKTRPRGPGRSAYEILGISRDADWNSIQAAYKQEIKKYHPDKVSHLGEEFSHLANEKFLEIQKAYESLKARTGN